MNEILNINKLDFKFIILQKEDWNLIGFNHLFYFRLIKREI